uniref:histidine kinase n=1 Tax=Dechloromonas aromatica (strain RCB) TaxID=159087 RepID=Q47AW7_DECAR
MYEYREEDRQGYSQSIVDQLGRRSFWIFTLLALVAIAAYAIFESQTASDRAGAAEINLAGRRRMLSQHIGLLASQLLHRNAPQETQQLADAINDMAQIHDMLLRDARGHGFHNPEDEEIDNPLTPAAVIAEMQHFLSLGQKLATTPYDSPEYRPLAEELVALSLQVLPDLDRLVGLYQAQSEQRTDALRFLQACALVAALCLLAFSGLGILRPLIRQVRHALEEQEKSETALRHAIEENRLILETTDEGMFGIDRNGYIRFANRAAATMLGRDASSLVGRHHHPEIITSSTGCPICRMLASAGPTRVSDGWFNHGIPQPNAAEPITFPVEYSVAARPDGEGTIISFRDIADRHAAEIKLQRFQQRLVDAIEAMDDAFALFDGEDRLILHNLRFAELFSPESSTIRIGMSFSEFIHDIAVQGLYPQTTDGGNDWLATRMEMHRQAAGSSEIPLANGSWLRITERHTREGGTVVIWSDVSNLKRALIAADQGSQAKSEFLARMSHELRTPLNAILGFARVLEKDAASPLNDAQQEYVHHILHGGQHLLGLINEILDLSAIESGKLKVEIEDIDLPSVLHECLALIKPLASNREITLKISGSESATVAADRKRLKQVLLNLLSNAIKYNRHGGEVQVNIGATPSGIRLDISDTGQGIPPELAQRVFQPFDRLGLENSEGTGIGLAITRRLVELMGGSICFESTVNIGTTFRVELVPAGQQGLAPADESQTAPPAQFLTRQPELAAPAAPCLLAFGLSAEDAQLLRLVASTLREVRLIESDDAAAVQSILDESPCRAIIIDETRLPAWLAAVPPKDGWPPLIALSIAPTEAMKQIDSVPYWQLKPIKSREMARLLREIVR